MTVNDARSEVARLNSHLLDAGLAVTVNPAVAFQVGDRTRVSWPQAKDAHGLFTDNAYGSISEYRAFLGGGHYTVLLRDGGLLQVSFDFKNAERVAHRFCFYPCPLFLTADMELDWDPWNDLLEEQLFAEIDGLDGGGVAQRLASRRLVRCGCARRFGSTMTPRPPRRSLHRTFT